MKRISKAGIFFSIMAVSMYLNIENVISLFLAGMADSFPDRSLVDIQSVYSTIFLVELFAQIGVAWIAAKMSKRMMIVVFQAMTVLGGMIAFFFGTAWGMLMLSSVVIGLAAAVISTVSKSIILEAYPAGETAPVFSAQQIIMSLGTIVLQVVAGVLAEKAWNYGYLTFLFGSVSVLSALFLLPEGPREIRKTDAQGKKTRIWNRNLVHDFLFAGIFIMLFNTYPTSISFLVREKAFGDTAMAGYLSSIWTAAMMIAAFFLGRINRLTGKWVFAVCCVGEGLGFLIMALSGNIWLTIVGICIAAFAQGVFAPTIVMNVGGYSRQDTMTASVAIINIAVSGGVYLVPYLVTAPASHFGTTAASRFLYVAFWIGVLAVAEILYQGLLTRPAPKHTPESNPQ